MINLCTELVMLILSEFGNSDYLPAHICKKWDYILIYYAKLKTPPSQNWYSKAVYIKEKDVKFTYNVIQQYIFKRQSSYATKHILNMDVISSFEDVMFEAKITFNLKAVRWIESNSSCRLTDVTEFFKTCCKKSRVKMLHYLYNHS